MDARQTRMGVFFALAAYTIWGIAPIYFKIIEFVPAEEILSHRIIWSFIFMLILLTLARNWYKAKHIIKDHKKIKLLFLSSALIGGNWFLFIWAVNHGYILEASLGYFINPIFNVFLGMLFLGERFRPLQWVAILLAFIGVLIQVWTIGSIPIIAIGLAMSFGFYGLVRKKIGVDAQTGMLIETLLLFPIALIYLFFIAESNTSHLEHNTFLLNITLMSAGIITTVPLLLFTAATTRLRLSTIGFFQYLGPTIMFVIALTIYQETVNIDQLITFIFIWIASLIFVTDALYLHKKRAV